MKSNTIKASIPETVEGLRLFIGLLKAQKKADQNLLSKSEKRYEMLTLENGVT